MNDLCEYFADLGVLSMERKGGMYPVTGQAGTIQTAFLQAMEQLGIEVIYNACIGEIVRDKEQFVVHMDNKFIYFDPHFNFNIVYPSKLYAWLFHHNIHSFHFLFLHQMEYNVK